MEPAVAESAQPPLEADIEQDLPAVAPASEKREPEIK